MHTILHVEGLHCASCETLIKDIAGDFPAIRSVSVDIARGEVALEHDNAFRVADFAAAINTLEGYRVSGPPSAENLFTCPLCGLRYRTKDLAERCQAWCREHKSCNLEIIQHAVPDAPIK